MTTQGPAATEAGYGQYNGPGSRPATPPPPRDSGVIPFGDLPNQVMPDSWAEAMLRKFYARDRAKFGRYLNEFITKDMTGAGGDDGA